MAQAESDGTVYQRKDGKWIGAYDAGWTREGKRRRITVTADTQRAARRRLSQRIRALKDEGGGADPRTTVKAWADEYLRLAERELRPNSFMATRSAVRHWIVPTVGKKRLSELEPKHVRSVTDAMRGEKKALSSIRRTHSVLVAMLKAARAEGHSVPLRAVETTAPTANVSDREALTSAEAIAVLAQASDLAHGSRWMAAFLQGMRQGECRGLTWEQVDLQNRRLVLSWQLQALPYRVPRDPSGGFRVNDGFEARQIKGRLHLTRPKTKSGWRVIPLVQPMIEALEAWREIAPPNPHGLVWTTPTGEPLDQKKDDAEFYELQRLAGVKHPSGRHFTVHEARHSTATLLLEVGTPTEVITAIMGHSSYASTRAYLHADTTHLAGALDAVATRLALNPGRGD